MATIYDGQVQRYNSVARALHWILAILIIGNLAGGLLHDALEGVVEVMPIHKATGLLILALAVFRIVWRLTNRPPPLPGHVHGLERTAAQAAHAGLYALMLVMPLTGWIFSSAGKWPLSFYGLFDVPKLPFTKGDPIVGAAHEGHEILGWVFLALIVLHIAAALRHHFVLKDNVLRRMA